LARSNGGAGSGERKYKRVLHTKGDKPKRIFLLAEKNPGAVDRGSGTDEEIKDAGADGMERGRGIGRGTRFKERSDDRSRKNADKGERKHGHGVA